MEFEIPESGHEVVAAVDANRVKVSDRGDWIRKYHEEKRRGWIKVHVAVDIESKELLSIESTDERTGDSEVFENLVENLDLKNCLADGAYNAEKIFELLEEEGVGPPGIKIRKDATTSLSPRGEAVREFQNQGDEEWKEKHDYGKRWSVEGPFSAVKRKFALYNPVANL